MVDVVLLEGVLQEVSAFMEQTETDDSLGDTDTLSTEDATETELGRIVDDLLDGLHDTDRLATDLRGLHDDLETAQWVGNDDVDGRDDSRRDEAGGGSAQASLASDFLLDVFLETRLSDQTENRTC